MLGKGTHTLGPAPKSTIGVILRAIYNEIISLIQLLMSGGSTQHILVLMVNAVPAAHKVL